MKILVVQETDWLDRNPILHHRMLETMSLHGDEVTVVDFDILWHTKGRWPLIAKRNVVNGSNKFFDTPAITVVRPSMVRLPVLARFTWVFTSWLELRRIMRSWRPDVIVAYSVSNALIAQHLARHDSIPFVYHVLDALHTLAEPSILRLIAKPVEKAALRRSDEVVVVNRGLDRYVREMGAHAARIHLIPMGADVGKRVGIDTADATRSRLGFDEDDVVLIFMGWLYSFSGLLEVVQSIKHESSGRMKLLVVGDGDLYEPLRRICGDPRLRDRVRLTGRRPANEMPSYLAAADVGLLPAHRIATMEHIVPAKVIEYMEAAKPVVATRLPGIEAEFGDLPGMLYIDDATEAVARVTSAVMSAKDPRAAAADLGGSCFDFMRQRPGWDDVTDRFSAVVHSAKRVRTRRPPTAPTE